jgi:hypothetical protein
MATRFHATSSGSGAVVRTVPNLPGALVRRLSERLAVSPTVAMRVALLYGDIEWQAGGHSQLRYSASDYARRMGFHRNTVHGDLQRLRSLGAIGISCDRANTVTLQLLGLLNPPASHPPLADASGNPASSASNPCPAQQQAPCLSDQQPLADANSNPLLPAAATLEKASKTHKKQNQKRKREKPTALEARQEKREEPIKGLQRPEAGGSEAQGGGAQSEVTGSPPEARAPDAEPREAEPKQSRGEGALLDRLVAAFQETAPPEWPTPERLTPSRERRCRLRQALEHAGSAEALESRLRAALTAVPAWYRSTYPVRPDGERRPAYQFFDVLFRASAAERDCGVEAWHLFSWSEGGSAAAPWGAGARPGGEPESDLQRARRLLEWESCRWCAIGIEGIGLPQEEKRRLACLLEERGFGIAGTAARQYGPPLEPTADARAPASIKPRHNPVPPAELHPSEPSDAPADATP